VTNTALTADAKGNFVRANGIDIHYVEEGTGEPLLLLHGGLMSTDRIWAGSPPAYVTQMGPLSERFRVIAPDLRGHGQTKNPGNRPISYAELADDAGALIDVLRLERPMICGFSAGAAVATLVGIKNPGAVRAIVNHAGFDVFDADPRAPTFVMARQVFGGRPDATEADPPAFDRFSIEHGMSDFIQRLKSDHVAAQGPDGWKALLNAMFEAFTTPRHSFDELRKITAPMLILTGDRDFACSVEQAVQVFRMLPKGELSILPGHGHYVPDSSVRVVLEFLRKYQA